MDKRFRSNIPNLVFLIRPYHFGYNSETALSNKFQKANTIGDLSTIVTEEFDGVIKKLRENDIQIKVFDDINIILPDAIFPNNWISTSPDGIVTIYPMQAENRRAEIRPDITRWVEEEIDAVETIDLSGDAEHGRYLEGTGSIVFDHFTKKAYACESDRTNLSLFEAYCNRINYRPVSFESLDLSGHQIYHTNVMLSIAEKYVLINLDSIENILERSFVKKTLEQSGKKVIPLSHVQMNGFAANALEVLDKNGRSCLVMSETGYEALSKSQIQEISHYSKIVTVNVKNIEKVGGGSIRCMLAGIFR